MKHATIPGSILPRVAPLLIISLALFAASCATTDFVTGQQVNNIYTLQDDIDLGTGAYHEMLEALQASGIGVNADSARVQQIQTVVSRIATTSHLPDLPYEVTLFETNVVNAAAFPGGKLVVFQGLFDSEEGLVHDEDELAAVIGHEIAHVTCRHSTESMTRDMPFNILLTAGMIWAEAKEEEDAQTAIAAAFVLYQGLLMPKYSRDNEFEADRVGLMYMARAGYDPRAAPRIWSRAAEQGGSEWGILNLLSSHPAHNARSRALEAAMPEALAEYERAKAATASAP